MRRLVVLKALAAGVLVTLLVVVLWQANQFRVGRADDSRRDQAVATARDQVIDLTTLDSESVSQKLKALAGRTSGDFREQLNGVTNTFEELVKTNSIEADGSIDGTAVSEISDKDAVVLVASTAIVKEGSKEPVQRSYRVRVKLERVSGAWKINGMEFVQ